MCTAGGSDLQFYVLEVNLSSHFLNLFFLLNYYYFFFNTAAIFLHYDVVD